MRLIRSYYPKAGVSQTGLDCHTNIRNKHRQMLHLTITLIETTFLLYLRAFQGLFHPRTEKYVRRSNIVSKKRSNTKNFVMELSKISRKGTKKTHTHLRRKQAHVAPPDFGEFRLAQVSIPQVPHAAHEVFGVVR